MEKGDHNSNQGWLDWPGRPDDGGKDDWWSKAGKSQLVTCSPIAEGATAAPTGSGRPTSFNSYGKLDKSSKGTKGAKWSKGGKSSKGATTHTPMTQSKVPTRIPHG